MRKEAIGTPTVVSKPTRFVLQSPLPLLFHGMPSTPFTDGRSGLGRGFANGGSRLHRNRHCRRHTIVGVHHILRGHGNILLHTQRTAQWSGGNLGRGGRQARLTTQDGHTATATVLFPMSRSHGSPHAAQMPSSVAMTCCSFHLRTNPPSSKAPIGKGFEIAFNPALQWVNFGRRRNAC